MGMVRNTKMPAINQALLWVPTCTDRFRGLQAPQWAKGGGAQVEGAVGVTGGSVHLVFLQLPDAQRHHGHQQKGIQNQDQWPDPPPPLCKCTRHDGFFALRVDYESMLQHLERGRERERRSFTVTQVRGSCRATEYKSAAFSFATSDRDKVKLILLKMLIRAKRRQILYFSDS